MARERKKSKYHYIHRVCGGGVEFIDYIGTFPPIPRFRCSKCLDWWTYGEDGGPWSILIPREEKVK